MSLTSWRIRRVHAQQKRKALQMLALSGVVRPSDVEMRYPMASVTISGIHTAPEARSPSNEQLASPISESTLQSPIRGTNLFRWLRPRLPASSS